MDRVPLTSALERPCRSRHQFKDLEVGRRRVGGSEPSAHLSVPHHHDRAAQRDQFFKRIRDENDANSVLREFADQCEYL
jgi:hypothetical protein